jgi:hypothetical protein
MAYTIQSGETPEEAEQRKREVAKRRFKILSTLAVLSIIARFIIKDPPPPKNYQRNFDKMRFVPGMLDNIPVSEQAKMDPRIIAKMMEADELARKGPVDPALAQGPYKAMEPPMPMNEEKEIQRQQFFAYTKKHKKVIDEREKFALAEALAKPALVRFKSGGYIKATSFTDDSRRVRIQFDRTLVANLPKNLILATDGNSPYWEKPIPKGFKKLKPAEGITIIIGEQAARRISIRKKVFDES